MEYAIGRAVMRESRWLAGRGRRIDDQVAAPGCKICLILTVQ